MTMTDTKRHSIEDFLTQEEIDLCMRKYPAIAKGGETDISPFTDWVMKDIVEPNLERINKSLGQKNDARYLAYVITYVMMATRLPKHHIGHINNPPTIAVVCDYCNEDFTDSEAVGGLLVNEIIGVPTSKGVKFGDDAYAMCPSCKNACLRQTGDLPPILHEPMSGELFVTFIQRLRLEQKEKRESDAANS